MCDTLVDQISLCLTKYRLYKLDCHFYSAVFRLNPIPL